MKKIFSLFAAVLFAGSMLQAKTIYLNGGGSTLWNQADAVFFIHAWKADSPDADVKMAQVEGDVYSAVIPDDYNSLVFVRMPAGSEAINWDTKWNESTEQTIPEGKDCFTMTSWKDGVWSKYGEVVVPAKFYITGDSALVADAHGEGKEWNPASIKSENDTCVLNLKANQKYKLKITLNGTWEGGAKGYDELSDKSGFRKDNDNNIVFQLSAAGEVKVVYIKGETDVFKVIAENLIVIADGYYLVGSMNAWEPAESYMFVPNNEVEFKLDITLAENDEFKVVKLDGANEVWYPEGDNYKVDAAHAGAKTVYFRPDGQGGEGWFSGVIYVEANSETGISNTAIEAKAVKTIINGQLVIIKGGKVFNATGAQIQ